MKNMKKNLNDENAGLAITLEHNAQKGNKKIFNFCLWKFDGKKLI